MNAFDLRHILSGYKLKFGHERILQDCIEAVLQAEQIPYIREYRIGRDAVDFFVGGIALECKVSGGPSAVLEQLLRYAESEDVREVLLVTSKQTHRFNVSELRGKLFTVYWVAGTL